MNTGWTGGGYGQGRRIDLAVTRRIIDAIHAGGLERAATHREPVFGLEAVREVPGIAESQLLPWRAWGDDGAWEAAARRLAGRFRENFQAYAAEAGADVLAAGPA